MGLKRFSIVASAFLVALLLAANVFGQNPNPRQAYTEALRNTSAPQRESVKSDGRSELASAETAPQPRFAVQVGAYQSRGDADALAQELRSRYHVETLVTPLYIVSQTLYRVRVPVGTKADAEALAARIGGAEGFWTLVLPLTRRELNSARGAHRPHPAVLSKAPVQSSSVTLAPDRSMPVQKLEQQAAPVHEVDISQTEPSVSSDAAENTAASASDTETNEATAGVLRVDEELAATSSDNCYAYELDEVGNRITFNDPSIYVVMPPKSKRDRLRSRGTPAQIFWMKNCDTIDPIRQLKVYSQPSDAIEPDGKIPSTVRVVVLAQQRNWIQVRAALSNLWKGEGWIRLDDDLVVVKY